jgi:hypothetical protein
MVNHLRVQTVTQSGQVLLTLRYVYSNVLSQPLLEFALQPTLSKPTHHDAALVDIVARDNLKIRPPPSPMTPMPQPPPAKSAPLLVNKPTPPVPPNERYDDNGRGQMQRSRSASASLPINDRVQRRRPMLPDGRGSYSHLSTLPEDIPEIDSPIDLGPFTKTKSTSEKIKQITGSDDALAFHNAKQAMINLPWFLRPSYPPEHIIMDKDFNVRAGTLPALVERLTSDYLSADFLLMLPNVSFINRYFS